MAESIKMLDLFCGTKSMANVFGHAEHNVFTVDNNSEHNPDLCIDIMDLDISMLPFIPDVIHASPPCTCFSVASMGHHWTGGKEAYIPKTNEAKMALKIVDKTINLLNQLKPIYFFIENPVGLMRKLPIMIALSKKYYHHVVTYCQYGDLRMKPTDWWTNCNYWHPKPRCHNGDSCHESAPRGSSTGTQGLTCAIDRAVIPKLLCEEIMCACCRDTNNIEVKKHDKFELVGISQSSYEFGKNNAIIKTESIRRLDSFV